MPDPTFHSFLERSLAALAREMPEAHAALCRRLRSRPVLLHIDDEHVTLASDGSTLGLSKGREHLPVEFHADSQALLALTAGELTFLDAALSSRIVLIGALDDLVVFYDALLLYLQGAVRCPSLSPVLDEFAASRGGHRG